MDIIEWLLERMGRQRRGEGINPLTHAGYEVHNQAYGTPAPRATPSVGGGMSLPVMQRMVGDLMSQRAPVQMGIAQQGPSYAQQQAQKQAAMRQAQLNERMAQAQQQAPQPYYRTNEPMPAQSNIPRRFTPPQVQRNVQQPQTGWGGSQDKLAQVRARHQAAQELQKFQNQIQQPQKRTGDFNAPRSIQSGHQWF